MDAWQRWYPPDIFPSLWVHMEKLIADGDLTSTEEVRNELEKKHDELFAWVKTKSEMFLPLRDDIQHQVRVILEQFPKMVDQRSGKSFADPFVVATARATGTTVVTGEAPTRSPNRPKIPDVCNHFKVPWINTIGLIRKEGWKF
jgi:hypothetical protein